MLGGIHIAYSYNHTTKLIINKNSIQHSQDARRLSQKHDSVLVNGFTAVELIPDEQSLDFLETQFVRTFCSKVSDEDHQSSLNHHQISKSKKSASKSWIFMDFHHQSSLNHLKIHENPRLVAVKHPVFSGFGEFSFFLSGASCRVPNSCTAYTKPCDARRFPWDPWDWSQIWLILDGKYWQM